MEVLIPILVLLGTLIIEAVCNWLHNDEVFPNGLAIPADLKIPESISNETQLREPDLVFVERSREVLHSQLGKDPVSRIMAEQDAEARIRLIVSLYEKVTRLYGIPKPELKLTAEKSCVMGGYCAARHTLELNVAYLLVNDAGAVREFLDTIFHELRHAVQHYMVSTPGFWEGDPELRGRIAYNLQHYIRPEMDPEGYSNQLIERDARNFAAAVMSGV